MGCIMKFRIPFISRLLEIKEKQLEIEAEKIELLNSIHYELEKLNRKKRK